MNALDLRSVVLLCGAIGTLMSVVLFHLYRNHRRSIGGLGWWASSPLVIFLGTLLLAARGLVPAGLSIVTSNLLVLTGAAGMFVGTAYFYGRPHPRWVWALAVAVGAALIVWGAVWPHYGMRLLVVPAAITVIQAAHLTLVWRNDHTSFAARFLLASISFSVVALGLRAVTAPLEAADGDLFVPSLLQNLYLGSYAFALLAQTVGMVLLAQQRLLQQLDYLASHDPLTSVLTRRAVFDLGMRELERGRRSGRTLSVVMIDLDHFKQINDQFGHLVGDQVLRDFAKRAGRALRRTDLLGRFGGEEFIAILPETDAQAAQSVAERIRTALPTPDLPPYTVSIGITEAPALAQTETMTPEQLLEWLLGSADQALFRAKNSGRNRTVIGTAV